MTGDKCVVLKLVSIRVKKNESPPAKQDFGTFWVLFKNSDEHPHPFYMGVFPPSPCNEYTGRILLKKMHWSIKCCSALLEHEQPDYIGKYH